MKKQLLSAALLSAGLFGQAFAWNIPAQSEPDRHQYSHNFRHCSSFMSIWLPNHPYACPATEFRTELAPGLDAGHTLQAFDWRENVIFSDITLQNNTADTLPVNSKLIIRDSTLPVVNASNITQNSALPYFLLDTAIEPGESVTLRAEFELRFQFLTYRLDFEYGEMSDGSVTINGEAMVTQTLVARITDPDGLTGHVNFQWQANGEDIDGATQESYTLKDTDEGKVITVNVNYLDDNAFPESLSSQASSMVIPRPDNIAGHVSILGERLIGSTLAAVVNDDNSISQTIHYQWQADGQDIPGETQSILIAGENYKGKKITLKVDYIDYHNYSESLSVTTSRIATTEVHGEDALVSALANAADGDWIALADGDYDTMAQIDINNAVTLTAGEGLTSTISGATCIVLSANQSGLVDLTFDAIDAIDGSTCSTSGESSVYLSGDSLVLSGNRFLGEVSAPLLTPYNWVSIKGSYSLLSRNTFQNKNLDLKGAAISMYNNTSIGDQYGHVIEYNLFKDFVGGHETSAYAIQVGRSTGSAANGEGGHAIRYNRFENILSKQRLIKVQSSFNQIYNNTIEDSIGGIALENGHSNIVASNIILSSGEDAHTNDSGISFTPYGHTISGNYIAGLRTTSSQRGGLYTNSERAGDSGNLLLTPTPVTVTHNTILNSRQPIHFSANGCVPGTFIVNFDSNLIANGEDPTTDIVSDTGIDYGFEGRSLNGEGRDAIIDNCALNVLSTHNNEHYYSADLSKNASFSFLTGTGNIGANDSEGLADIMAAHNGLFEGQGNDLNIGADTHALVYLKHHDVGPQSVFAAPASQTTYDKPIAFDLSQWNITFPDGSSIKDPQWLMDGNTVADEFFYGTDGSMTFKTPNIGGTTTNSTFSRTELREMIRGPEQDPEPDNWPKQQGLTKNNWVFGMSYQANEFLAGGVNGSMSATLRIDHVDDEGISGQVGRVIVGQIHASVDEPIKLYYRLLPGNTLGSIYFNHEIPGLGVVYYDMIGGNSSSTPNPVDGVALGEIWSYDIITVEDQLTVNIHRAGKPTLSKTITMDPSYANDWLYFKAGVYNQNNTGLNGGFAQATFFSLIKSHDEPPSEPGDGRDEEEDNGNGENDGEIVDAVSLQGALLAARSGDVVEITDGNYSDMGTIVISNPGVTLTRAEGSTAVISGTTCLYVTASDTRITGLEFQDIAQLDSSFCQINGNAALAINGDRAIIDNNVFDGDALNPVAEGQDTFNWLALKKSDALVERNTFQNRNSFTFDNSAQLKGGFISVYITGSGTNNTIQYNVFKNFNGIDQSTAYALQIGRSTGNDSIQDGLNTVQYNRFDNIDTKTRLIRIQGSNNVIHGNTIVNSQGMIALENGQLNEVSNNVILPSGNDSNDGGISFAPFGHTVINNYIAGSSTTTSERAALYFNSNTSGSGNALLTPSTVMLTNNSVINAKQALMFGAGGCGSTPIMAAMDNNLVANGVSGLSLYEGTPVYGVAAVRDDCTLALNSTINGDAYYSASLSANLSFDPNTFGLNNTIGLDGEAPLTTDSIGFIMAIDTPLGANTSSLVFINETDVGAYSSTTFTH